MALVAADIIARFPEFTGTATALIDLKLAEAYRRTTEAVWGDLQDDGAAYLTAHLLALTPDARDMRVGKDKLSTIYQQAREDLEKIVSSGFRVTGL